MKGATSLKRDDSEHILKQRRLVPVIRMLPAKTMCVVQDPRETSKEIKQIPQFYTDPIFRARKYDFL